MFGGGANKKKITVVITTTQHMIEHVLDLSSETLMPGDSIREPVKLEDL